MIPEIGIMVGMYIALRCVETFCKSKSFYEGSSQRIIVGVVAALTLLITGFVVVDLLLRGSSETSTLPIR